MIQCLDSDIQVDFYVLFECCYVLGIFYDKVFHIAMQFGKNDFLLSSSLYLGGLISLGFLKFRVGG